MTEQTTHKVFIGYFLWIFGFLGAHRFYYGRQISGTIYLLTLGLFLIGWIVDLFLIPGMVGHDPVPERLPAVVLDQRILPKRFLVVSNRLPYGIEIEGDRDAREAGVAARRAPRGRPPEPAAVARVVSADCAVGAAGDQGVILIDTAATVATGARYFVYLLETSDGTTTVVEYIPQL